MIRYSRAQELAMDRIALFLATARKAAARGDASAASSSAAPVPAGWADGLLAALPEKASGPSPLPLFVPVTATAAAFNMSKRPKQT